MGNLTLPKNLIRDIPQEASDSFYSGQIYRWIDVVRNNYQGYQIPSFLCLFTNGVCGHNIKYLFVQWALLALFKVCNFDTLNVGRCASYHDFVNPAERCM